VSDLLKKRIDNIKSRVKIRSLIQDYGLLPNQYVGDEFQMRCPFHGRDNTPSAHVYAEGHFHCFACHRHFDVISFFQEKEHIEKLPNALRALEQKYNIPKLEEVEEEVEKIFSDEIEKPKVSIEYEFNRTEKFLIDKKKEIGLEKYSKLLYVLDDAFKNNNFELIDKVKLKAQEILNVKK
jgi:hypothetical protein